MPKNVYRDTPLLSEQALRLPASQHIIAIDSTEWFQWLAAGLRFAYQLQLSGQRPYTITFRAEKKQRGGIYWSAYMKDQLGKLHKLYVGKLTEINRERLTHILNLMREKLAQNLSYPTPTPVPARRDVRKTSPSHTMTLPLLTSKEVEQFRRYDALLTFCTTAFEQRWGRAWQWQNGKIYRSTFDKYYYVMDQTGEQKHILGKQRYFVVLQLLHWVNHGYDEGYNDKLPNASTQSKGSNVG